MPTAAMAAEIDGFASSGTGLHVTQTAAWKSPDYSKVYFVAARFTASGIKPQVGVWASNAIDGSGSLLSVDGFAKQFSDAPDADKTDAKIGTADRGVGKAKDCL